MKQYIITEKQHGRLVAALDGDAYFDFLRDLKPIEPPTDEVVKLIGLIHKLHAAKGRYHTQLAACDLFDAVGLKNERPVK